MQEEEVLVATIRSRLQQGHCIAVVGWKSRTHSAVTQQLEKSGRVAFFERAQQSLPKKFTLVLATTEIARQDRVSMKRFIDVHPIPLTPGKVKRVLDCAKSAIPQVQKLVTVCIAEVINKPQQVITIPIAPPFSTLLQPEQNMTAPTEIEKKPAMQQVVVQSSNCAEKEVEFAIDFCKVADDWENYLVPRVAVTEMLRKHFGEEARAKNFLKFLAGAKHEEGSRIAMYAPSALSRSLAGCVITADDPAVELELGEEAFLATQPGSGADRAIWLINNRATFMKFQNVHIARAEFFGEKIENSKKAEKALKTLESF